MLQLLVVSWPASCCLVKLLLEAIDKPREAVFDVRQVSESMNARKAPGIAPAKVPSTRACPTRLQLIPAVEPQDPARAHPARAAPALHRGGLGDPDLGKSPGEGCPFKSVQPKRYCRV